jgi:hypothetical protein
VRLLRGSSWILTYNLVFFYKILVLFTMKTGQNLFTYNTDVW